MLPDAFVHRRKQPHERRKTPVVGKMQRRPGQRSQQKGQCVSLFHENDPLVIPYDEGSQLYDAAFATPYT